MPPELCDFDVTALEPLGPGSQQDHERFTITAEVHPVAGSEMDAQLEDTLANALVIWIRARVSADCWRSH